MVDNKHIADGLNDLLTQVVTVAHDEDDSRDYMDLLNETTDDGDDFSWIMDEAIRRLTNTES
jgi:hypothetical protein